MESPPDNPNRIRRLDLEQRRRQLVEQKRSLLERAEAVEEELRQLDAEYASLPFHPPAAEDIEFRRVKKRISISEQIFRLVQEGASDGATYVDIRSRLGLTRPQLYCYVKRLEDRGLVRRDVIGGEKVVVLTLQDLPYGQPAMRLRLRME